MNDNSTSAHHDIWMSSDQSKLLLRCGLIDDALHCVEQLPYTIKQPCQNSLLGYPGRVFEDIAEGCDKVVPCYASGSTNLVDCSLSKPGWGFGCT